MTGLLADCKHALRLYLQTPISALIAVLVLAIAIAFVSSSLTLYVDLFLKPFPGIEGSSRIVTVGQGDGTRLSGVSVKVIEEVISELSSVEAASAVAMISMPVGADRELTRFEVVSNGFFGGIRPRLAFGRGFDSIDHDPDAEPVVVISDHYWREKYAASPNVLGELVQVGRFIPTEDGRRSTDFRIVGVMSPDLTGVMGDEIAFWAPFERIILSLSFGDPSYEEVRETTSMRALARLSSGASASAASREFESSYPDSVEGIDPGSRLIIVDGVVRDLGTYRDLQRQLRLLLAGSILLALVAAASVNLFLLARAPGRRREIAIRMSVGAPMRRIARQLASESSLLVIAGIALGLFVRVWFTSFARGLSFLREAEWIHATLLDWRVLGLTAIFLLILASLVSLTPIVGLRRLGLAASSRQVAARATLGQRIAGTVQVVIAGSLGGAAVAFGWFLATMVFEYPGYEVQERYLVQFETPYTDWPGAIRAREIIESLAGVRGFAVTSLVPARSSRINMRTIQHPVEPSEQINTGYGTIDSRYLDVLGMRLLRGRAPMDGEGNVALVNRALAEEAFGRENVVGESIDMTNYGIGSFEIVGVLSDVSLVHPAATIVPTLFAQPGRGPDFLDGIVETSLSATVLRRQLLDLTESGVLENGQPSITSLATLKSNLIAPDRARSFLTIGIASLVVLLTGFGFYGTQCYLVAAGRREYAIRASMGAGPRALGRLVLARGLLLGAPGLVIGALFAFIAVAWLRDGYVSREISPAVVTVAVVLGLVTLLLLASFGPASRARRTQPAPLLRED